MLVRCLADVLVWRFVLVGWLVDWLVDMFAWLWAHYWLVVLLPFCWLLARMVGFCLLDCWDVLCVCVLVAW